MADSPSMLDRTRRQLVESCWATRSRRAGLRQDLAIGAFRQVGLFGRGGTAVALEHWLADAGLRVDRLTRSGAVVHFAATRAS